MGLCISKPVAAATAVDVPVEKKAAETKEASDRSLKRLFDKDVQEEEGEGANGQLKRIPEEQEEPEEYEKVEPVLETNEEKVAEKTVPVEIEKRELVLDVPPTVDKEAVVVVPVDASPEEEKGGTVQESGEQSKVVEERPSTPEISESKSPSTEVAAAGTAQEADIAVDEESAAFEFNVDKKTDLVTQDSEKFELIVKQVSEKFEIPGVPEVAALDPEKEPEPFFVATPAETTVKDTSDEAQKVQEVFEETSELADNPETTLKEESKNSEADKLSTEPAQVEFPRTESEEPSDDIKVVEGEQVTTEEAGVQSIVDSDAGAVGEAEPKSLGEQAQVDGLETVSQGEPSNGEKLVQGEQAKDEPTPEAAAGETVQSEEQAKFLEVTSEAEEESTVTASTQDDNSDLPVDVDKSEPVAQEDGGEVEAEQAKHQLTTEVVAEAPPAPAPAPPPADQSKAASEEESDTLLSQAVAQSGAGHGQVEGKDEPSQVAEEVALAVDQAKVEVTAPSPVVAPAGDEAEVEVTASEEEPSPALASEQAAATADDPSDSGRKEEFFETSEQMPDAEHSEAIGAVKN